MATTLETAASTPTSPLYDVLIAGAGPVGLFLAGELALAGCSVLILEKADSPASPLKQLPFGLRGLNAPSIEALDRRGLLSELELHKRFTVPHATPAGQPAQFKAGGHFAGIQFPADAIDFSQWPYRLPSSTSPQLVTTLEEMETVLTRRAETLGVTIWRGLAISGFQQAADGVTVQTGRESFTGRWLVGCDGSRSVVRKLGGFEFAGTEPEFTGYTAQVDLADPEKLRPGRSLTATGMYLQSQPGYLVVQDFDGGAFHATGQPITRERFQEVLRRISGTDVTVSALHVATTWTDRARQATTYRHGRVLLAGDAAHIHSPLGGQGLNLGLGDALNLGWKLAATIQQRAPPGLLDSYYAERYPLGAQVLDWSRAQVAVMSPSSQGRALQVLIRDLINTRDGATYFAGRIWGLLAHYPLGGTHPLTGHSTPNFQLAAGPTVAELLHDGQSLLLDFTSDAQLAALASRYDHLKYVAGPAQEPAGLHALLLRPDGIVAWATDGSPDYQALEQAAGQWFASRWLLVPARNTDGFRLGLQLPGYPVG